MFAQKIGERDCHIMPASALKGYFFVTFSFLSLTLLFFRENLVDGLKWMAERVKRNAIWRQPDRPGSS